MPDRASVIDAAISALAGAHREAVESAAAEIFRTAHDDIEPFVRAWTQNPEFAALVAGPAPQLTGGVAVTPELFAAIRAANNSPRLAQVPPEQDAAEFHLNFENGARLEILTTRNASGEGAIARYLRKFGIGLQHIEIATANVDRATTILATKFALQPIYPAARPGADNSRINFFLVTNPAGKKILVELEETSAPPPSL